MTLGPMASRSKKPWPFRIEYPPELPISARVDEIVTAIQQHQVVVLAGETGSGKTTQIPKLCLAAGRGERGRIACTQPRRVAATSVSRRVAEELGVSWGREVGCKIRFADQTSEATVIKFMTDGMLLAELQADPRLREYDTIIVDEAHERSLNIDFILGHLRRLRTQRPDLKIIITSATIDTAAFAEAFDGAPVIEVSGRVYPVEVVWSPLEEMAGEKGEEFTYLDAVEEAVERVLRESAQGDILVFLPTERDIREVCEVLEGRSRGQVAVVPLFGRLTNAEQQRVFAPTPERKVVVATNIAETSLTIPGIRFVIDTGLARVSRYSPSCRTRRLPVEPVAQSSADQRKGRCGRVSDGVCIRLFSEADYQARPRYASPEIQRSNLADVILRMKAAGLGDIAQFPFLNAPPAKGIRAGYALLEELGAIAVVRGADRGDGAEHPDREYELTPLGEELAQWPVDPTIGRMILQARDEKALREVLVIAAALSIQDPRERPLDQQQKAETAHRRFAHRDSDFLTLLAIWEAYHDEFETMTLGKLRKFCTAHFLSFLRMREWRDVHAQLVELVAERGRMVPTSVHDGERAGRPVSLEAGSPAYRAIHRSILAGLLGNIAVRGDDGGYKATHDRKVTIFPGSALHEKQAPAKQAPAKPAGPRKAPRWIMAAEVMDTGRMYARTCARIEPPWVLELGAHLVRASHSEPFWSEEGGRVLVKERRRIYNLEVEVRSVGYGKINPAHATEIFIREGLVGDTITWPFPFLAHNRRLRGHTEAVLTRTRSAGYLDLDEALYRFYAARLKPGEGGPPEGVSSVPELVKLVRERDPDEKGFLCIGEADLRPPAELVEAAAAFPETAQLENRALPLNYTYSPGRPEDGVTVRVNPADLESLTASALDWMVPGHLVEKIELLLKALPKEQRRGLIPLAETAKSLSGALGLVSGRRPPPSLAEAVAEELTARLGVRIDPARLAERPLPDHLRVRVEVVDAGGAVLCAGREVAELQAQLGERQREAGHKAARGDTPEWRTARAKWEQPAAEDWKFGDLSAEVVVSERDGVTVRAYPGLVAAGAGAAVRLFAHPDEARRQTRPAVENLLHRQLRYELGWLERDLRDLRTLGLAAATLVPVEELQQHALESLRRWACAARRMGPGLNAAAFAAALASARADLRGVVPRLKDLLAEVLGLRQALLNHKTPYPGLEEELAALLPADFVRVIPFERLRHLPRYLKARQARCERWKRDPAKDASRARELAPFATAAAKRRGAADDEAAEDFRWLVEEFRVSLFAQELGTAEPVSAVRLQAALGTEKATPAKAATAPAAALPVKGKTVLKSLGALGNLSR